MKLLLPLALLTGMLVQATSAASEFECPSGREGQLLPVRWSAASDQAGTTVRLGIKNTFDKGIRMVEAGVWFVDGLGRNVEERGFELDPDLTIGPAASVISMSSYSGGERLVGAAFEDFTAHICTETILFDDGTKVEF